MDTVPSELVFHVVQFLNPADRWRLSATNRYFRDLLPVWLRIRIVSPSSRSSLKANFYVSPAHAIEQPLLFYPQDTPDTFLHYDTEYIFWTYDYERENPVYLGRHGQKLLYHDDPQFLYTLGLRPNNPNQTWMVLRKTGTGKSHHQEDITVHEKVVPLAKSICLTVGGQHPKPFRPDSTSRLYLSAHELSMGTLWYLIHDKEWCIDEELVLLPSADYSDASSQYCKPQNATLHNHNKDDISNVQEINDNPFSEQDLIIHAIPDIMDGCYSLYSPKNLKLGEAACSLHHATIPCYYWIEDGLLFFHAFEALEFKFAVPILEEDLVNHNGTQTEPLSTLLAKNSSRWWAIKHYISTAADVDEGRAFHMETFLRNSKDHEDHTIVYDQEKKIVKIIVHDAVVDKSFPDVSTEKNAIWKFLLCS